MQTVGHVMPVTCVFLTCVQQKGLFCRVASEIVVASSFPRDYLQGQTFFFSYFSSLSFDITLAPLSGNFIGTKERDQETCPPPKGGISRSGDGYTPIYQLMLHRAKCSCNSQSREQNEMALPESMGKFKQIHEVKIVCSFFFCIFKALPSSSPSSACVSYILPSHLCHGFSGKCVYCKISRL